MNSPAERPFQNNSGSRSISGADEVSMTALLLYALLGALMGLAATAFIKGLSLAEGAFERIRNAYLRHAVISPFRQAKHRLLVGFSCFAMRINFA